MTQLSDDQVAFFKRHGISDEEVFDATGLGRKIWPQKMKQGGQRVAVGVASCKKGGHQIRTRAGHCAVCDPSKLAFSRRAYETGHVYLLHSKLCDLYKVGFTTNMSTRLPNLLSQAYGETNDWRVVRKSQAIPNAGKVEQAIQEKLQEFRAEGLYAWRAGKAQESRECFRCSKEVALGAFESAIGNTVQEAA